MIAFVKGNIKLSDTNRPKFILTEVEVAHQNQYFAKEKKFCLSIENRSEVDLRETLNYFDSVISNAVPEDDEEDEGITEIDANLSRYLKCDCEDHGFSLGKHFQPENDMNLQTCIGNVCHWDPKVHSAQIGINKVNKKKQTHLPLHEEQADTKKSKGKSYDPNLEYVGLALCFDDYEEKLDGIKNDKKDFVKLFKKSFNYNFHVREFGKEEFDNPANVAKLLKDFIQYLEKTGLEAGAEIGAFILYYHGHGQTKENRDCILTPEGKLISFDHMIQYIMKERPPKRIYLVNDSCRDEALRNQEFDPNMDKELGSYRPENKSKTYENRIIRLNATSSGKKAKGNQNKTFTHSLIQVLKENPNGIQLSELEEAVNEHWMEVSGESRCKVEGALNAAANIFPY